MFLVTAFISPATCHCRKITSGGNKQPKSCQLQICRRITGFLLAFAAAVLPFAVRAEKVNVFFIHGANVSEQAGLVGM